MLNKGWIWIKQHRASFMPLMLFAICVAYIILYYLINIFPLQRIKSNYSQTRCFISSKMLNTEHLISRGYRADFLVSYKTHSGQYLRWVSSHGIDTSFSNDQVIQEDILSDFDVGETYPCWYHPNHPEIAILVIPDYSYYPMGVAAIIAILAWVAYRKHD